MINISNKLTIANILGQTSSYGFSLYSFIAGLNDIVGIFSALAGVILTLTIAWGNYKIKSAQARINNAKARKMELENLSFENELARRNEGSK